MLISNNVPDIKIIDKILVEVFYHDKVEVREMENEKYEIIKNLVDNNGNKKRTVRKLGISIRQVNRLCQIYMENGKQRFVHGNKK